jgi:death-on-curing family protein
MDEILIYKSPDNKTQIEVKFEHDTVWLTQNQIGELFQKERTVITKHISNIFKDDELDEKSNVQKMHLANSDKPVKFYNLDIIISIGYRVNSKRGIQFRQWATQRLKDFLIKGYAINQPRLAQLNQIVHVIQQSGATNSLQLNEAMGLLDILSSYTRSFILLNQFDSNSFQKGKLNATITYEIKYTEAKAAITELKHQLIAKKAASELFGNEKDQSFEGTLHSVVQSFGGEYVYPTIEEQAAHLLYFIIKNHPFSDGNKRIGAFLFIWFLEKNRHRFKKNGEIKINDNALTALALLVAQSNPADKELMTSLICNLIDNG